MMRKIEDIYKNYNEKIMPSKSLDNKVFNETIYKRKINPFWKKAILTISIFLIVSITAIGIVFAKEIKEIIQKYFIVQVPRRQIDGMEKIPDRKFLEVHSTKEINYDADLPEVDWKIKYNIDQKPTINLKELEEKLQINFLNFSEDKDLMISIVGLEKINKKIGNVELQTVINAKNKSPICIHVQFVTKYTEAFKDGFSVQLNTTIHGSEKFLTEHSKKLNTDIYYFVDTSKEDYENILTFNEAVFVYDNVLYRLNGNNITKNMLAELIESATFG